jgi:uncharacterized Zn finger protein (UPF0148 family)
VTRNFREEHRLNGTVYCPCCNCRATLTETGEKGDAMKLPPEVKRAMEQVELDLKAWENVPRSVPDLLEELRRFERSAEAASRPPTTGDVGRMAAMLELPLAQRQAMLHGAWDTMPTEEFRKAWDADHPLAVAAEKALKGQR